MLRITVAGTGAFDGTFPLDLDRPFNGRELHIVKEVSGVRMGELDDAFSSGDYDIYIAFAVIALVRSTRVNKGQALKCADELMDAAMGAITIEVDKPEDEVPPPEPPRGGKETSKSS